MSELRDLLYESYLNHYADGKIGGRSFESRAGHQNESYQRQFGWLRSQLPQAAEVLDAGCGLGYLLGWLAEREDLVLYGVDKCNAEIRMAQEQYRSAIRFECVDALEFLGRNPRRFDAVFATDVLEHLTDPELNAFLLGVRSALKPKGLLAIRVPNMANLASMQLRYKDFTHVQGFTEKSLRQLLNAYGFAVPRVYGTVPGSITSRCRGLVENYLHQILFRVCGCADERIFSRMLYGVAVFLEDGTVSGRTRE